MKGQISKCHWSGCQSTFTKKKVNHKYCCDSHRKKGNRELKGLPLIPSFIQRKPSLGVIREDINKQVIQIPYNPPNQVRQVRQASGTNYRWLFGAVGLGVAMNRGSGMIGTSIMAGLGYVVGNEFDKSNAQARPIQPLYQINNYNAPRLTNRRTPSPSLPITVERMVGGESYRGASIDTIGFKDKWLYLVGDPSPGFLMLVTGMPGNGKSTLAIRFSQYFEENHGKVLYLSSEQRGLNKPFQKLLQRYNGTFTIDTQPTKNVKEIIENSKGFDLLVIDSVNNLQLFPIDIEKIKKANPKLSIVLIMQSTKDGKFKGSQEFLHDCDIRVNCEKPKAKQTKSRYNEHEEEIMIFQ